MRIFLSAVLILTLAACEEDGPPPIDPDVADRAEAECIRADGRWVPRADSGTMVCLMTPRDAGKSCSAASDCSTLCLARSKTCAPVQPLFGCNDVIGSGGQVSTLCID